ncbi:MAG: PepSY-associated TM helix domain-containing protein [Pseudomonadota bacterium]
MIALSQENTRRLVAVHGWSGTVFGLFLYVVILTGAAAVLAHEIGVWSVGGVKMHEPMSRPVDQTIRDLATSVPEEHLEEVTIFHNSAADMVVFFHTHTENPESGNIEDFGTLLEIDPITSDVLARREGFGRDVFGVDPGGALDEFLVDLHVNLLAPSPWGLYATGILGLVMMIAALTGLLIHRHLIKDAFLAPRSGGALLGRKDRHVLAGTWGLLFAFILAFTGSFFSFAGALGLPLVAVTAFGGDQTAMFETLVGAPKADDPRPAPLADLDGMLAKAKDVAGSSADFVVVSNWGRADANVQLFHAPPEGSLLGSTLVFKGASGEFEGSKPRLGTQPSAGSTTLELVAPLHFGNFAGLLSKVVWVCLGLAMCYVTITGLQLWLERRQQEPFWRRMLPTVDIVALGTPISLVGAAHGFFLSYGVADTHLWTLVGFCGGALLSVALGLAAPATQRLRVLEASLAGALALLPAVRMTMGGSSWADALGSGNALVLGMDVLMLLTAATYAVFALRRGAATRRRRELMEAAA